MDGSSSRPDGDRGLWKNIWSAPVPSKIRVFAWKVVNNGLPTRANRCYRHMDEQKVCQLCGYENEDIFHAVIRCPHARTLRLAMRAHWELPVEKELINSGPDWLLLILDRYGVQTGANFLMLIWRCWNVRNNVLMAGECISIEGSVIFLSRYMDALVQVRQQETSQEARGKQITNKAGLDNRHGRRLKPRKRWCRLAEDILKINVDGAFVSHTGAAALGVVIRNMEGAPMLMACRTLANCRDAEEAEALACLDGIRMGAVWPEREFVMETDCAQVLEMLRMAGVNRSVYASIIHDTLLEAAQLSRVVFSKIGREQNNLAHELAHRALSSGECRVWLGDFLESLISLACKDVSVI